MKVSKKSLLGIAAVLAACASMSSCVTLNPVSVSSNTLGNKVGESSQQYALFFAWNKGATIQEAAQKAGIKKISAVEVKTDPLWPLIGKRTTVVYGE